MNGGKVTFFDGKLLFKDTGVVLTSKGDILLRITDYGFNKTDSADAKQIVSFLDEIYFDTFAKGKSLSDKNLMKNYFIN